MLATDRPISLPELYNSTRSTNYKIGIVVLNVDKDGKGTGTFSPLCKVKFNRVMSWRLKTTVKNRSASPMCMDKSNSVLRK